jgi:wyosine [tRNA(Phe)-imidazoG37] synthetase (radical SAM superfamily)
VSQPTYRGRDLDLEEMDFDALLRALKRRGVQEVNVNGHGETTMVVGWHERVTALADAGFSLSIITNFARLLSEDELAAMARIKNITVSVDTHNPEILRKVRRHVSLGNILTNMTATRAKAAALGRSPPTFIWSCVVNDRVAPTLIDYIHFGFACGVRHYHFCNLVKYPDVPGAENVNHVSTLPTDALKKFAADFKEAKNIVERGGGSVVLASGLVDTVEDELSRRLVQ